jgi:hypothetical protein
LFLSAEQETVRPKNTIAKAKLDAFLALFILLPN